MQVTNNYTNLQIISSDLLTTTYTFDSIKSVGWAYDSKGYYTVINFISNDKNNSLRLYLKDVDNQPFWFDNPNGAIQSVNDISSWIQTYSNPIPTGVNRNAKILRPSSTTGTITETTFSISFSNVGTANATISSDFGNTYVTIKPNEVINFDSGGNNNYFLSTAFRYNCSSSELLIIYVC